MNSDMVILIVRISDFLFQAGTNRKRRRTRGLTLSLNVWTLPKGVLIPVSLNTSGEPVGKEASTLNNFLSAIARDGILAPLIYQDWRRVPEKNKDIMWRIVKVYMNIAILLYGFVLPL
jgi:hypothetical protein